MTTGCKGAFLISWGQTKVDGQKAAPLDALITGATWRWTGDAVRIDGPGRALELGEPTDAVDCRRRAARVARRLVGAALGDNMSAGRRHAGNRDEDLLDQGFVLTDGRSCYFANLIDTPSSRARLLMFVDNLPPQGIDLWVVRKMAEPVQQVPSEHAAGDVICFTPGTLIRTQSGSRPIEDLLPGDRVLTRDDGPQELLWMGHRKMSGARLYAMPALRPIRIRAGALGIERPEPDLLVSPQHRLLLRGPAAQALFSASEVLVAAADLVNNRSIVVDRALREVSYIHLMFERHQVIWANGLETESFHPANTSLDMIEDGQRESLLSLFPDIGTNPESYGDFIRRNLTGSEAALLRHDSGLMAA